jgi:hypothetical protein
LNFKIIIYLFTKSRENLKKAFQIWADVTPLSFAHVCSACQADITVAFATDLHDNEDPEDAFDGQGNILAHASYPPDGKIHFDDDEDFSILNFALIAAHEIGYYSFF